MGWIDTTTATTTTWTTTMSSSQDDNASNTTTTTPPLIRSSQSIDVAKQLVRNVVVFRVPSIGRTMTTPTSTTSENPSKPTTVITLTVLIAFQPDDNDARKINVKFESCRIKMFPPLTLPMVSDVPSDITIPLGIFGPSGWLRTTYLDDTVRITRGFKGSVFVLTRTSSMKK